MEAQTPTNKWIIHALHKLHTFFRSNAMFI